VTFERYERVLATGIVTKATAQEHVDALEELQRLVFPSLDDSERFKAEHYRRHIELFPEGQFVALAAAHVVGMTTTLRMGFDFDHPNHRFADVIGGGWLTAHDPGGDWLYGADIGTHPDWRRRGIARALYRARHDTVKALGLRGQVTVGMLRGYGAWKDRIPASEYYRELLAGVRTDPTVSTQMRIGFEPRALVPDYVSDPVCDGFGVLLVLPADREVVEP
jgi:GNAT superfamily N-acetyltransferase